MNRASGTDFIAMLQEFLTHECIAPSALRGHPAGTINRVREFLTELPLAETRRSRSAFCAWRDRKTELLLDAMRLRHRPWGAARKAINLFLRSCVCSHYLRSDYGLDRIEPWLEVPLDSVTAAALRRIAGRGELPAWPGLKRLTKPISDQFQTVARKYAEAEGFHACVYVDNYLWLRNR